MITGNEGESSSQGTCLNGPWTWTTVWGLTVGTWYGGGLGKGGQRGKIGTTAKE